MMTLIAFLLIFVALISLHTNIYLSHKIRKLRLKTNQLLEEKAQLLEEADHYAELAKNPLGPLFEQNVDPFILAFDTKGKITSVNNKLLQKFGYTKSQLVGKNAVGTVLPQPDKPENNIISRLFRNPNLFLDAETKSQTKSGEEIWISWTNNIVYGKNKKPVAAEAVGFDITKRKNMEAELQYLASIDPQTGALNRPALLRTGEVELKSAKRYKRDLSVVAFTFFSKEKNHSITDEELKSAVALTRRFVRSVDYLGRIGDSDFALILPETIPSNVPFLIQRIEEHLSNYNKQTNGKLAIKYAAVNFKKKSDTFDNLLGAAWRKINTKK